MTLQEKKNEIERLVAQLTELRSVVKDNKVEGYDLAVSIFLEAIIMTQLQMVKSQRIKK